MTRTPWAIFCAFAFLAVGCIENPAPPTEEKPKKASAPAVATPQDPKTEARQIFDLRCAVCHGTRGMRDGPGAAALEPKPRHFSDAAWQAGVDDARLTKIIVEGGVSVGLSPGMAANPDLATKPEVVKGLIAIVRSFAK